MKITVRGFVGNEVAVLQVDRSQTIQALKQAIYCAAGVAVTKQRLLAGAVLLRDVDRLDAVLPEGDAADLTLVLTDRWAHEVEEDWKRLRKAPEALRNDPEVVLKAIECSKGEAIKFAGEEVRAKGDVLLAAMRHDASLVRYSTGDLTPDTAFMLAAAECLLAASQDQRQRALIWKWAWHESAELCASRVFILFVVSVRVDALRHAAEPLRADRTVVSAAVRQSGLALAHASAELRGDREIARLAVQTDAAAFRLVDEQLRADRDFVMELLGLRLWRHRSIHAGLLQHAPPALRADPEIVSAAVQRCASDFQYASEQLRGDHAFVERALQEGDIGVILSHITEALQCDHSFMLPWVRRSPWAFQKLCPAARADRKVALEAVKRAGSVLSHASEELQADLELVLAAVHQDSSAYRSLKEPLVASSAVAMVALGKDWRLVNCLPHKLCSDRELLMVALQRRLKKSGKVMDKSWRKMTASALWEKIRTAN